MITEPAQADEIVRNGRADLVMLARELLARSLLAAATPPPRSACPSASPPPPQYERAYAGPPQGTRS